MINRVARLVCWWRGCDPAYARANDHMVPCGRCAALDTTYSDRVGDTRSARVLSRLANYLWIRPLEIGARLLGADKGRQDPDATPF